MIRSCRVLVRIALAACLLVVGCKDTPESAMEDVIADLENVTAVLKDVKDKVSALAAESKIKAGMDDMGKSQKRLHALEQTVSESERRALSDKYGKRLTKATFEMMGEALRVSAMDAKLGELMR